MNRYLHLPELHLSLGRSVDMDQNLNTPYQFQNILGLVIWHLLVTADTICRPFSISVGQGSGVWEIQFREQVLKLVYRSGKICLIKKNQQDHSGTDLTSNFLQHG